MLLLSLLSLLLTTPTSPAPTDWRTPFERGNGNTTATYDECIGYYQRLDAAYPEIQLREAGTTDSGRSLHVVVVSADGDMEPASLRAKGRRIVFIQNGIHPGEPEGIDASLMLARDYVQKKALRRQLDDVVLVIIPIYNVGGALNRNSSTRTNQNGPESYGFRGNARNLDLNRDYIKQDSRNARSFAALFQRWQPDVYVDTHTSNGADYQYTLTLIATQKDKLHPALSQYMQQQLLPALYGGMDKQKWYLSPYVDFNGRTPDARGLQGFLESPRYSTGYTALFNTIGFVTETHMLKAYTPRVRATYDFLRLLIGTVQQQKAALASARTEATRLSQQQQAFALGWRLDTTQAERFTFRGYEGKTKPSDVSGQPRLYYDRKAPYTKSIPYYNTFVPTATVQRPRAYVLPQAWGEVAERLRLSGVQLRQLSADTVINGETYYIQDYKTSPRPYEGHYLHSGVQVRPVRQPRQLLRGDFYISLNQPAARYLIETLEPQATDSFFAWGFFDSILQQKEYFSDYVFEDLAAQLLRQQPALQAQLNQKKQADPAFAASGPAQLDWLYRQSDHYEPSHLRYPVLRVL
ncbi:M14 family metallopeptidase [Hymenobacter lapidiphilus]|uniref:M14 family metallopeptidase n=1 Tax=Hymenobacter lapidiphilus TaxID=2608003 RepID=A0A7Y7PQ41_9BACT|nr:M14 family metallopeptidase [Hymenobacter lapidiphilus]NVO31777.1 M14 family metallopeptidase [Hymenobacter lapidiphilus]